MRRSALSLPHSSCEAPAHRRRGAVSRRAAVRAARRTPQPQQAPARPGVQVGVPEGRGGGGRASGRRRPRTRRPVRRSRRLANAEGRVLLGGATPVKENGVWLPGGGGAESTPTNIKDIPFQPWARGVSPIARATSSSRTRAASRPASRAVPHAVRRRVRRAAGAAAHLHLRHRRAAHLPHDLHGRPLASGEPRRRATTGTRSAGGKATRSSSTRSASTRASGWIGAARRTPRSCTRSSGSRAPISTTMQYEVTIDDPGAYTKPWKSGFTLRWDAGRRAVRVRLPAGELRPRADGRLERLGRSQQPDRSREVMRRHAYTMHSPRIAAAALFLSPLLTDSLVGQQQQQQTPQRPGVQVGVPEGRAGGAADDRAARDAAVRQVRRVRHLAARMAGSCLAARRRPRRACGCRAP